MPKMNSWGAAAVVVVAGAVVAVFPEVAGAAVAVFLAVVEDSAGRG